MRRRKTLLIAAGIVVAFFATAGFAIRSYRHYKYPYGWSHCCENGIFIALFDYAERHGGWYPRGEATPEASLSLLYRQLPEIVNDLRGKTVPESVVRERLERGELLTPETCGWHYVEGLRSDDDSHLALFWDKAGLGHNGERLDGGGHIVNFLNGERKHITADQWNEFLAEQEKLRAAVKR